MGIRPGETTPHEAVQLLSASDWVGRFFQTEADNVITWAWSGKQPVWIDSTSPGHLVVDTKGGRRFVSVIDLQSTIPVSTLWLAYGVPERGFITTRADQMIHFISFPEIGMDAYTTIPCSASWREFWGEYAYIFRGVGWRAKESDSDYPRLWRQHMTC